jgi:hypothetical protein
MHQGKFLSLSLAVALLVAVTLAIESPSAWAQGPHRVRTSVMGGAGSPGAGGRKKNNGTLGQPTAIGTGAGFGNIVYAGFWKSGWQSIVTESETPQVVRNELFQNYPNPFNPSTTIQYSVAEAGHVELMVYNVAGQRISSLVNDTKLPGKYTEIWDGRNDHGRSVATGIYFYRLRTRSYTAVKKMILLR